MHLSPALPYPNSRATTQLLPVAKRISRSLCHPRSDRLGLCSATDAKAMVGHVFFISNLHFFNCFTLKHKFSVQYLPFLVKYVNEKILQNIPFITWLLKTAISEFTVNLCQSIVILYGIYTLTRVLYETKNAFMYLQSRLADLILKNFIQTFSCV